MQAADKKRTKEEKDILHLLRPFARLQTAEDFEQFQADILCASRSPLVAFPSRRVPLSVPKPITLPLP